MSLLVMLAVVKLPLMFRVPELWTEAPPAVTLAPPKVKLPAPYLARVIVWPWGPVWIEPPKVVFAD